MKNNLGKLKKVMAICLAVLVMISANFSLKANAATPTVWYCVHVADLGWLSTVINGATAGTENQSRRIEALQMDVSGIDGGIRYRSHVADIGWMDWVTNRETSGTVGQSKRVEAVEIQLTGAAANYYDIVYRVHAQNIGWMDWVSNGQTAGTTGESRRIEAIQVKLVAKTTVSSSVLNNSKVQEFITDSRWCVGTTYDNSTSGKLPQTTGLGTGCNAYARDFVQYVYGKSLTAGSKYTNISELRAGDVVYVTPQHWMVILERNGNNVTVIHGNWTGGKVCQSSYTISNNKIGTQKTFSYGYHY